MPTTADRQPYLPLCVTADMAGPIAMLPHEGLPLDGILEYAAFRANAPVLQRRFIHGGPGEKKPLPPISEAAVNFQIPLKRIGHLADDYGEMDQAQGQREKLRLAAAANWHWACSWAEFPAGFEQDVLHWAKRRDYSQPALWPFVDWQGRPPKINISSGRDKAYYVPLPVVVAPTVRWHVLGDYARIAGLLTRITHLGKKGRAQGVGEVLRWRIAPAGQDFSCWRDGRPMRQIPMRKEEKEFVTRHMGLRPPYWHHQMRRLVICPERLANGLLS